MGRVEGVLVGVVLGIQMGIEAGRCQMQEYQVLVHYEHEDGSNFICQGRFKELFEVDCKGEVIDELLGECKWRHI